MSCSIKLSLSGKKHNRSYKIVVAETRYRRDGKPIDTLGFYNPLKNPPEVKLNLEKAETWIKKGAILTPKIREIIEAQKSK